MFEVAEYSHGGLKVEDIDVEQIIAELIYLGQKYENKLEEQ